jgi:hypothetical protein
MKTFALVLLSFAASASAGAPPAEVVYQRGMKKGWMDFGWSPRKQGPSGEQLHDLHGYGGWIVTREQPMTAALSGRLSFTFQASPQLGDFLELKLDRPGSSGRDWPKIRIGPKYQRPLPRGALRVEIPMSELNPSRLVFDRIVFFAYRDLPADAAWVAFDDVALTQPSSPEPIATFTASSNPWRVAIDCSRRDHAISPLIYGIAFYPLWEYRDDHQWSLRPSARRWGGNHSTRYNYLLGEAWNAGMDWFFRNLTYTGRPGWTWETFLETNARHGAQSVITLPMMGWVAKDTRSSGFPLREFPDQQSSEASSGAGNGRSKDGKWLKAGSPTRTSVTAPPEFVAKWVKLLKAKAGRLDAPVTYILDNEPGLWDSTHHDVHPDPVSYDELWERTRSYASAVKRVDPAATIAGPAEWGWSNYFYSQRDLKNGGTALRPDRRMHGDVALIPWYLKKVAEYERQNKVRLVDVLDLHFYPQGEGIGIGEQGDTSLEGALRRIRSTRALWDPTYHDESWIDDEVRLIPRMKRWIAENAPGMGTQIGEWNFGAEGHISGGLAVAEALGRFGEADLTAAYYWTYPPDRSPAYWAFRAYRDYDGAGGRFQDWSLRAKAPPGASVFASTSSDGSKVVAVVLNLDPKAVLLADLELEGCNAPTSRRVFSYAGGPEGFERRTDGVGPVQLEPFSINVVEWTK